jgi:hypothetical protein
VVFPLENRNPLVERALAATAVAAAAVGSSVVLYFDPSNYNFFPVCPLFKLTGFACPGCGLTRGFHALFHGDVLTALHFNALIPIWAAIFGYLFLSLAMFAVRGKALPMRMPSPLALWIFLFGLLAFGVLRNLPIYPFNLLYP